MQQDSNASISNAPFYDLIGVVEGIVNLIKDNLMNSFIPIAEQQVSRND